MTTDNVMRELNTDELEAVSGGAQFPIGWPDGPFGSKQSIYHPQ
jgi:bacteriocin-like protein